MVMPPVAWGPVKCNCGGKHLPTTHETRTPEGVHIKYPFCKKCQQVIPKT